MRRFRLSVTILALVIFHQGFADILFAQEITVTMRDGRRVEGLPGSTDWVGATLAAPDPYGVKPIILVDDGLKRTFIARKRIANTAPGAPGLNDTELEVWQRRFNGSRGNGVLMRTTPFDENGHRTIWIRNIDGRVVPFVQGVTVLNPYWTELRTIINPSPDVQDREWTMKIATSDLPPSVLQTLLHRNINDPTNLIERRDVVEFYVAAQMYRRASQELDQIIRDFPDNSVELRQNKLILEQEYGRYVLDEVRFRESVGQVELAKLMSEGIDITNMAGTVQQDYRLFQQKLNDDEANLNNTKTQTIDFIQKLAAKKNNNPEQLAALERFIEELDSDLRLSNVNRLAPYQRLINGAQQSEEQLAALAISGWLMGAGTTTDNFAVTESMFIVRDLVKEYLSTADRGRRVQILKELEKYEASEPQYLAAMLNNMLPPKAPDISEYTGEHALEFEVNVRGVAVENFAAKKFKYLVHLPPEYDLYRKYPCLITLRSANPVEQQLERWAGPFNPNIGEKGLRMGQAIRHGYIVVSLDWKEEGQGAYEFSAREHKAILNCLRDCLKMFSIDSDRVFLNGHGVGADAAYDVAVSHPEHFAGVIGISGKITKYPEYYMENRHLGLNVYSVVGTKDLLNYSKSEKAWNKWLSTDRYNDVTVVDYHGRLAEPFREEFESILQWCDLKRRPWPSSGMEEIVLDCKILRPWDNYYWFIEYHGLPFNRVMFPEMWPANGQLGFRPLSIEAKLKSNQPNVISNVSPDRVGQGVTIWLSPDYVDFSKKIRTTGRAGGFNDFVQPSREVMLEDVRRRGDRKRPFWAKIELN